jgi:hypothetical protein
MSKRKYQLLNVNILSRPGKIKPLVMGRNFRRDTAGNKKYWSWDYFWGSAIPIQWKYSFGHAIVFPCRLRLNSRAIAIHPARDGVCYETLKPDCRVRRVPAQFFCIAIHPARDRVSCETLKPFISAKSARRNSGQFV